MDDAGSMRKSFLKAYLFALMTEGEFAGLRAPTAIAAKAIAVFTTDVPIVALELLREMAAQAVERGAPIVLEKVTSAVLGKMNQIAKGIKERGFGAVWKDLQEQYKRGMDANINARKRRS